MSETLTIAKGQGLSQAIATKLQLDKADLKKIPLSTWQSVMTIIKEENERNAAAGNPDSIFSGGSDVATINQRSNWRSNFIVHVGDVEITDETWNKILQIFGRAPKETAPANEPEQEVQPEEEPVVQEEVTEPEPEVVENQLKDIPDGAKIRQRDIVNVGPEGSKEHIAKVENEDGNKVFYQVETDPETHEEKLGQRLIEDKRAGKNHYYAVDDTVPETAVSDLKTVDGQKDSLIIKYKDEDGKTQYYAAQFNEETGIVSQGDRLYEVAGTSGYYTQAKRDEIVQRDIGTTELPDNVSVQLMKSHGDVVAVYKIDGKRADIKDVKALINGGPAEDASDSKKTKADNATPRTVLTDEQVRTFADADPRVKAARDSLEELKSKYETLQRQHDEGDASTKIRIGKALYDAKGDYEDTLRAIKLYEEALKTIDDTKRLTMRIGSFAGIPMESVTLDNGAKGWKCERMEDGKKVTYYFELDFNPKIGLSSQLPGPIHKRIVEE